IHTAKNQRLLLVRTGAEILIQLVRMRPEFQRQPKNFENIAMHAAPIFFRVGYERLKFWKRINLLGNVGINQIKSAVDRVAVRVDESRKETLAPKVDPQSIRRGLLHFRKVSDRENFALAYSYGFRIRALRIGSEDLCVIENLIVCVE